MMQSYSTEQRYVNTNNIGGTTQMMEQTFPTQNQEMVKTVTKTSYQTVYQTGSNTYPVGVQYQFSQNQNEQNT